MLTRMQQARAGLLLTTAVGAALSATVAFAQDATAPGAARAENSQQNVPATGLEEVVVTATRQTDTVNRVPLSVTAETQRSLDQQGIRNITDLQATVPALIVNQQLATGVANVAIRGIVQGSAGQSTTGFYLDDTPLQKRNIGGGVATGNGTPLPPLFDLDRVEVLRGPQGTLFGGGSEGGTIRYIQPAPSLTRYSAYAKGEISHVDHGDTGYEAGIAVGGPIIQDKLGFRASFDTRRRPGFIDNLNAKTGALMDKDSNWEKNRVGRIAVTWAMSDRARATLDYFNSYDRSHNINNAYNLPINGVVTQPTECFNTNATPTSAVSASSPLYVNGIYTGPTAPLSSLVPGNANRTNLVPVGIGAIACNTLRAAGKVTYQTPGGTYGPYTLGKYQSLAVAESPTSTQLQVGSLTLDYDFEKMSVKSITSWISDNNKTLTSETSQTANFRSNASYNFNGTTILIPSGLPFNIAYPGSELAAGHFDAGNRRYGLTQELRFSSAGDARPFSWVAGVFYSNQREKQFYQTYYDLNNQAMNLYGITDTQRYGVPAFVVSGKPTGFDLRNQTAKDVEVAAFGEGNYWVTEKLRLTAGVRYSRVSLDYFGTFIGPVTGNSTATQANGSLTQASITQSPITPHVGAQYQITNNDMVYVTAARGFRAGGVNPNISRQICGPALDQYGGLNPSDLPLTYSSDTVWSYEGGTKLRLLDNRVQFNFAGYQIDWQNPQYTASPGFQCGLVTTYNAVSARSRGLETEVQARLFTGLVANVGFGYNNTQYTAAYSYLASVANAKPIPLVLAGQKFALPPYTLDVGLRYDVPVTGEVRAYARGDFRLTKGYEIVPFGTSGWNPDANIVPTIKRTNLRVGVEYRDFDINVFANNLFNSGVGNIAGGRSGCALPVNGGTSACTSFTGFNPYETENGGFPREIGLQIAYRH